MDIKKLIKKLKYSIYFIWNKYFRSDKVYTQNGRIYSRKEFSKEILKYSENKVSVSFGELSHPTPNDKVSTFTIIDIK